MITSTEIQYKTTHRINYKPLHIAYTVQLDLALAISWLWQLSHYAPHWAHSCHQTISHRLKHTKLFPASGSLLLSFLSYGTLPPAFGVGFLSSFKFQFKCYHHRKDLPAQSKMLSNLTLVLTILSLCLSSLFSLSLFEINVFISLLNLFPVLTMKGGTGLILFPTVSSFDRWL